MPTERNILDKIQQVIGEEMLYSPGESLYDALTRAAKRTYMEVILPLQETPNGQAN